MSDLNTLHRPQGSHRGGKRLGRGPGSGTGKTSGKGHKGHKARTGTPHRAWFEGGQMPIQRRVPKRGFSNSRFRTVYETVNVRDLERIEEDTITPEVLAAYGLVDLGSGRPIKILGDGDVGRKLTIRAHAFTKSARSKIESAGGAVDSIDGPTGSGAGAEADVDQATTDAAEK